MVKPNDWDNVSIPKKELTDLFEMMQKEKWKISNEWEKESKYEDEDEDGDWSSNLQPKRRSPDWETFLKIIEAVSRGETPEWLTLKGKPEDKAAADFWTRALKEIERRKKAEEERLRVEAVKKAALDKLSEEEKKVLGLK